VEEFLDYPHELITALPDESVVGTFDNDKLRAVDTVAEHLRWWSGTAVSFEAATTSRK
jgi:hypothetical protein